MKTGSLLRASPIGQRLKAYQLNGLSVAVGVSLVQAAFSAVFGLPVGLAAVGGGVFASLPDVPNPPYRVWRRVIPAVLLATLVTLAVGLLRSSAVGMTTLIAVIAFGTLMAMAWGARAGPLSFTGVLSLVFAMAWQAPAGPQEAFTHAGWVLAGALSYSLWARFSAVLLRRRYRELAVAAALRACVQRLRSRAERIRGGLSLEDAGIRASIADDVVLAEALQAARDQVFAAQPSVHSRRQIDLVLGLIELRDLLLASRLDLHLLGDDDAALAWRMALAATLLPLAETLEQLAKFVEQGAPLPEVSVPQWRAQLITRLEAVPAPAHDPRRHLVDALQSRIGHMFDDIAAMVARCQGPDRENAWTREQLQPFVSPEGWPLAALKPHLTLQSGVMRHALRGTLALSLAYVLGLMLPWAAHPHWLVLSVAVVLRGNLEQTLARRNDRIIGTVMGCLLVLALAHLPSHGLLSLVFVLAVGVAHAYVNQRYRVAATAATLMALLQPLMLHAGTRPAVAERLADTVIGALLAWAFCFVLPAWERRSLGRVCAQLRAALARHAGNVLCWAPNPEQQIAQRLSRQQAYTALAALAAAAQRTRVEPREVRLPERELEAVLSHGYRLMALLGAQQQLLNRRRERLDAGQAPAALATSLAALQGTLKREVSGPLSGAASSTYRPAAYAGEIIGAGFELDREDASDAASTEVWPLHLSQQDLSPWLLRRLALCEREAAALTASMQVLLGAQAGAGTTAA
ncbi:FUSC family protein [Roseateles koreensis]|uniref:FUSC family protein n=1 Tax=Roseateles koreensis TaxID=2987526 RepID=A0ABT5KT36_9BURK|nr:FUSC family protein [Roseateles koreensis]MDC8784942.1 FUSC family protein [Roseateles koreensis]